MPIEMTDTSTSPPGGDPVNRPKTEEMIERFKRFYGFRFDTDMARKLELWDGSAIGNWRRRDSIDLLLIAERCPEINLDWLVWGRGTRRATAPTQPAERPSFGNTLNYLQAAGIPRQQIISVVNEALEKYLRDIGESEDE